MATILDKVSSNRDLKGLRTDELPRLAEEIRKLLVDVVSKNGGHLSSNLGVVELTIALHYVFNSPEDKILWDVGHQAYVHKIITDRKDRIDTIRMKGGLSPFTNPSESIHDHFISGHAGNILSAAYGIAEACKNNHVIAVVGDASFSSGPSLEAINNIGGKAENLIVVINDNEMSIGENVGAMFKYLSRIMSHKLYSDIKVDVEEKLRKIPFGNPVADVIKRLEHSVRYFIYPGSVFEELGFDYIGPIDGHNFDELLQVLKESKERKGPLMIHVKTTKGKGYGPAEKNKEKFHGVSPFDIKTGELNKNCNSGESYSQAFGRIIVEMAEKNSHIIAISAAMISGTGLSKFSERFPDRLYDVGIAEEHAVTFAAGLAKYGKKPIVTIYSTFLQRAYDQIIHDVALQRLPVVFVLDRAGIVGDDGPTHHGVFDISYLSHIPNITLLAPASLEELKWSLEYAVGQNYGPVAIRMPRSSVLCETEQISIELHKWREVKKGNGVLLVAAGSMLKEVYDIEDRLKEKGITPAVVSPLFIKPLDTGYILNNFPRYEKIVVLEDGSGKGGFGSSILEFINDNGMGIKIKRISIGDRFVEHGKREELMEELHMRGEHLLEEIVEYCKKN